MKLKIIILTKNEEKNLPSCLDNIPSRYPVIVVDSGSKDRTIEIARAYGCTVYHHQWKGFSEQRNYALTECGNNDEWILFIDADEMYPRKFFLWMESDPIILEHIDVLMIPSILIFCGRRLLHAPGYPIYHPRLVRSGITPFTTGHAGHSETFIPGIRVGYGDIPYDHYFFDGDIDKWMTKHIKLARMEAFANNVKGFMTYRSRLNRLMGRSFFRVPGRFIYHYLIKKGFLDGWPGLVYSLMYAWYELTKYIMVVIKKAGLVK